MKTTFMGIGICMLLMILLLLTAMGAEASETHSVYMSERYLTGYDRPWDIKYFNFWHFSLFRADQSRNYVNFSFSHDNFIVLVIDNEPRLIQGPVHVYLGAHRTGDVSDGLVTGLQPLWHRTGKNRWCL